MSVGGLKVRGNAATTADNNNIIQYILEFVFLFIMVHFDTQSAKYRTFTQTAPKIGDAAAALGSMRKLVSTQSPKARWTGSSNLIFGV